MIFCIAKETGWTEEIILQMPLARVYQYQHCAMTYNGIKTKKAKIDFEKTKKRIEMLKKQK